MHSGIMLLLSVYPAQETNQNAGALFVSYIFTGKMIFPATSVYGRSCVQSPFLILMHISGTVFCIKCKI